MTYEIQENDIPTRHGRFDWFLVSHTACQSRYGHRTYPIHLTTSFIDNFKSSYGVVARLEWAVADLCTWESKLCPLSSCGRFSISPPHHLNNLVGPPSRSGRCRAYSLEICHTHQLRRMDERLAPRTTNQGRLRVQHRPAMLARLVGMNDGVV